MKKCFAAVFFIFLHFISKSQDLKPVLSHSTAQKMLQGCIAYADSNKLNMAIAIYDINEQLVSFARMDGASVGSSKVAQWKGLSAATYQFSTAETAKWNVPNAPDIATVPGGLPIKTMKGVIVGGIGVSGAAASVDVKCAEAGLLVGLLVRHRKENN
jgi:glc operon protein GlcG